MNQVAKPNINRLQKSQVSELEKMTHLVWAHMLACSLDLVNQQAVKAIESGSETVIEVNPGIKDAVDNSSRPYLEGADVFTIRRLAQKATRIGDLCLAVIAPPNEVSRTLAVSYGIMKLIDQHPPLLDPDGTLAAAVMGVIMESDDDNDEVWKDAVSPKLMAKRLLEKFQEEISKP